MASSVYILLGSNQGNSIKQLEIATQSIAEWVGNVVQSSSIYRTAAWGNTQQDAFSNQIILVRTEKTASQVLRILLTIEDKMERIRTLKWAPRTIDLDILFYDELILEEPELTIPHPYLHQRRFTLIPMAEMAPNFLHPKLLKSISQLLQICPDQLSVEKISTK
ncbi:MAG: 2-amino-4-hydroxy-6-hydroxymethyldihydropteridine diphosphokinase [bacterium]|nr:2-amino-4-hydroxy-6-hydroxymethyldihydropteridine diphosphokinase [bacterium]